MNNISETSVHHKSVPAEIASWLFGIVFLTIGLINCFWGNDPGYGVFIVLLSFIYFPPLTAFLKKITGISIPLVLKIVVGIFILWSALGVGELFDKIELMKGDM